MRPTSTDASKWKQALLLAHTGKRIIVRTGYFVVNGDFRSIDALIFHRHGVEANRGFP